MRRTAYTAGEDGQQRYTDRSRRGRERRRHGDEKGEWVGEELKIKEKENNRKMKRVREGVTAGKDGQSGVKRMAPSLVRGIGDIAVKGSKNKYLIKKYF